MNFSEEEKKLIKESFYYYSVGEVEKTVECNLKVIDINPLNVDTITTFNENYENINSKTAKKYHKKVAKAKIDEYNPHHMLFKLNSLATLGKVKNIAKNYENLVKSGKVIVSELNNISIQLYHDHHYLASLKCLEKFIKYHPHNLVSLIYKTDCLIMLERFGETRMHHEEILETAPQNEYEILLKGDFIHDHLNNDELEKYCDEILETHPDLSHIMMLKAVTYWNNGDYEKSSKYFDDAIAMNPLDDETWFTKGMFLMMTGEMDESRKCYEKAFSINPHSHGIADSEGLLKMHDLYNECGIFKKEDN